MYSYEELLNVIAQLRGEHGCPWDKAQTHESLIPCLRNECEEVVQAIEQHDEENLCEELGDVLLQVLLHARIAEEEGQFTMADVVNGLAEKMVRRHPISLITFSTPRSNASATLICPFFTGTSTSG